MKESSRGAGIREKASEAMARRSAPAPLQGSFRVEMLGSQESLDLDCGKFFTVRLSFANLLCVFLVALRAAVVAYVR